MGLHERRTRPPSGGHRGGYWLTIVALLAGAVAVVRQADPAATPTAVDAAGLFSCSRGDDGGEGEQGELDQFLDGLIITLVDGSNFFTFQGLAPPGVPVADDETTPDPVPDPETGGTLFTRSIGPARLGVPRGVDFLDEDQVPGAEGDELTIQLVPRLNAGADGDDLGLQRVLQQNLGLPTEPGGGIEVRGVDVDITANPAMTGLARGFRGRFEAAFGFRRPDGTDQGAGFRFEINSLAEGAAIPGTSSLGFAFKEPPDAPTDIYYALGQTATFAGFDGSANQPALGFGLDLAILENGPPATERDLVAADLGWTAAPRQAAFGFAQQCPTRGHVGWNLDAAGLPDPEAAAVDVDLRLGDQLGQPTTVDDGAGGTTDVRASEVVVDGRITGLPALMDVILLDDAVSFTRSDDVAPDLTMDRLHLAADDPERDDELPLHLRGQLTDMPRHVLFVADVDDGDGDGDGGTGAIEGGELTGWRLRCAGDPEPSEPEAPEDLRRPLRVDTLPSFPEGCARHDLAPVPAADLVVQNWLPEDVDAGAATVDLRTPPAGAGQYGYFATRDVNARSSDGLFAFGGRITGLRRATVDLGRAADQGSAARVYVERDPGAGAADDGARFVVDVDALTAGAASGARVTTDVTVDDLPDALRLDYGSLGPSRTPLDVTWRASAPFVLRNGTFDARWGGRAAFELHGAFDLGAVAGEPLPPAARIQVTRNNSADQRNQLLYTVPDPPIDGFPTPEVPAHDPTDRAHLHVGAELTMNDDRQAGLGTRLHADLAVPQPIEVIWETGADGRVRTVLGGYQCDPGNQSEVVCQGGRYDVTVVHGPRSGVSRAALLTRPALPAPTAPVSQAVPAFTPFRPGSGARAVVLGPDAWGADLVIDGLSRFQYQRAVPVVSVQLADPAVGTVQPFRLQLLDASKAVDSSAGPRPQVLFADTGIDRLPRSIVVRQQDPGTAPDQPWLWVNTESRGIRDIADVDWTPDAAGTRPRLTGVLRLGDAQTLRDQLPVTGRPTAPRLASGADLWADYDLGHRLLALDAVVSLEVPRHVALWRPSLRRCAGGDAGDADPAPDEPTRCRNRPSYEVDEVDEVGVRYRTTSTALGDLNLEGRLHGDDLDWTARGRVEQVPGDLDARVTIARNRRLPWTDVDLVVEANTPVGAVWAGVADNLHPVEYREDADPDTDGDGVPDDDQCTEDDDRCTSLFAVSLVNVPEDFRISGRIQGAAEARLTPLPPEARDPDAPEVCLLPTDCGIGFLHAELDLQDTADVVRIEGRDAGSRQFAGTLRAFTTVDLPGGGRFPFPTPVSGFLNARVDHLTAKIPRDSVEVPDPLKEFLFTEGGILGTVFENPELGHGLLPLTFVFDFAVGLVLDFLFGLGADVTTDLRVDVDLPLLIEFDQVDVLRVGMSGITLGIDDHHPAGADSTPTLVATRQRALTPEGDLQLDGGYFHDRLVDYSFDSFTGQDNFDIDNTAHHQLVDMGLYFHAACRLEISTPPCYLVNPGAPENERPLFESSGQSDVMVDLFFTRANRVEMKDEDGGEVHPGLQFYKSFADASPPVAADAFVVPNLPLPVETRAEVFEGTAYCCTSTTFSITRSDNPPPVVQPFGPVCTVDDPATIGDLPRARGSDGTEYVVTRQATALAAENPRTLCDATVLVLEAHFPQSGSALGPPRWSIVLPVPAGLENPAGTADDGECRTEDVRCEISATVVPQDDGSVQVGTTTTVIEDGVDGRDLDMSFLVPSSSIFPPADGLERYVLPSCCREPETGDGDATDLDPVRAWVDASGHPAFDQPGAAHVDDFSRVVVPMDEDGDVALDSCEIAPEFGCGFVSFGERLEWVFGDGETTGKIGTERSFESHRYPRAAREDDYLGMLIVYAADGQVMDKVYFAPRRPQGPPPPIP